MSLIVQAPLVFDLCVDIKVIFDAISNWPILYNMLEALSTFTVVNRPVLYNNLF